jgi:succinate dehydrogenase / fumarate reductase cytochrome b subunit
VHLKNFHFTSTELLISDLVREVLGSPILAFYYIISLVALGLHLSHGFWSLFQTMGLYHEKYNVLVLKGALVFSLLLSAVFILIPVLTLISRNFLL